MWVSKVAPAQKSEAQSAEDKLNAKLASTPYADVEKSLASIRSHRSNRDDNQDDVPFSVQDWSPSWIDVSTDGYALFNLFLQATTSLFFLAITYTDGLAVVALALLEYILVLMLFMFLHLANFKGRQFVYVQLLERKVLMDLTTVTWWKHWLTLAIMAAVALAIGLFIGTWFDTNGAVHGGTAAAFAAFSSLAMVVLKQKLFLEQEKTLVPLNYIMQDDPEGANSAPSRKAWVEQLTVVKEVDFRRYVASRYVKHLVDPTSCQPMPHGRDKWDLMAADIMNDPDLDTWPERGIKDVEQSELWASWSARQRSSFKTAFKRRFGWAFYFGTVQHDKIEIWKPWVVATLTTSVMFVVGCIIYGIFSATRRGDAAVQSCT